ncbi:UDP-glucose/GDP-mannose dehydrogenase family protein [Selenomonas sp. AB3002]|uniref:UDP-glucose dehydrogenase family protein n=1 Tax=Selenomonas sp. AB3002 TaxID=1392502 RepID=UPI00049596BC
MKIAIAGTGYVGFVTAVCLAEHGHNVTCVDVDKKIIDSLNRYGKALIYEKDLDALMEKNKERLSYTTDYASAYKDAEIIFIGVGTPEKRDGSANLNYVYAVAMQIAETAERECVVVVKSTVPIGTNERIEKIIKDNRPEGAAPIHVASNPEFLAQGTAVHDTLHASRIVIGVEDDYAKAKLTELYKDFAAPKLITNRRSAEMIKYASNDFLALKISYINEIANLCEEIGADIEDVAKGMGYDKRIGSKFLKAGIGYGGSCFPKDTKALHWLSDYHEQELKIVKAAIEVNDHQKLKLIRKAHKYYEDLEGLTVAVLGLTFKPETADLRGAPSLVNIPLLLEDGAVVKVYDPVGMENFKEYFPTQVQYCNDIDTAIKDADLCLILTDWKNIKEYPLEGFKINMKRPIVLDGRNCYGLDEAETAGLTYVSMGRRTIVADGC